MRKGVLTYMSYGNKLNIGDYIQSLAAMQFLEKPVVYLNRERLDGYKEENVELIMNGWFLHEISHWPPSDKIHPIFVSFHLNSVAYDILDNDESINYFKKHEPIGCRDKKTKGLLRKKGIDAYFSGCLTLTLSEKYIYNGERSNEIYFVDPYYKVKRNPKFFFLYLIELIINYSVIKVITKKMFGFFSLKKIFRTTVFYYYYKKIFSKDLLRKANYISHMVHTANFKNEEDKFIYAESLLYKYSRAKMVITSRIHCALPCLSLETPVLYTDTSVYKETSSCRLDGLKDLLYLIKICHKNVTCELLKKNEKIGTNFFFKNKKYYLKLKDNLIKKIIS